MHKFKYLVGIVLVSFLLFACGKDNLNEMLSQEVTTSHINGGSSTGNPTGNVNSSENEPHIVITLVESAAGYLKVKFDPVGEMAYYKCGKGTQYGSSKLHDSRTYSYGSLNPNREYTFSATAYDSLDHVIKKTSVSFKTQQAPYTDYMRQYDEFYPIAYADMRVESLANNHKKKCLRFVGTQSGYWFQVAYISAAYETVDKMWDEGTYHFSGSTSGPRYYAEYNFGSNNVSYIGEGTMTIQRGGSIYNITVKDENSVVVVQFAGTLQ